MKKVLIIGGSGFLGSWLLALLLKEKYEVFAVVHKTPLPKHQNLHIIEGGISAVNTEIINKIKPEIIFHCARPVFPRLKKWGRHLAAFSAYSKNKRLLNSLLRSDFKPKLIFASGSLMYGNADLPHDEDSPLHPISYARQYFRGELPLLEAFQQNKYPVQIIRFPWLLGNGSWFAWFYLKTIDHFKAIPIFGEGNNMMEVIDVQDAASFLLHVSSHYPAPGIYNLPSPNALSQSDFVQLISKEFSSEIKGYKLIFPGKLEKETLEAFTSNILLKTKHAEVIEGFSFTQVIKTLEKIKLENTAN